MRLKEIEKEAKKEEILKIAREIFARKGFDNTSMEEIAKKVRIAKGTIYLYFPSKHDLLIEIINFAQKNVAEGFKTVLNSRDSALNKIKKIMEIYLDFSEKYPEYIKIFPFIHPKSDEMKNAINNYHNKKEKTDSPLFIILKVLEEGVLKNEFKQDLNINDETFRLWYLMTSRCMFTFFLKNINIKQNLALKEVNTDKVLNDTIEKIISNYKVEVK